MRPGSSRSECVQRLGCPLSVQVLAAGALTLLYTPLPVRVSPVQSRRRSSDACRA